MTILAMVNAEKEGQIESKMMKARQMEEIREAKRKEAEARQQEKKSKLVCTVQLDFSVLSIFCLTNRNSRKTSRKNCETRKRRRNTVIITRVMPLTRRRTLETAKIMLPPPNRKSARASLLHKVCILSSILSLYCCIFAHVYVHTLVFLAFTGIYT